MGRTSSKARLFFTFTAFTLLGVLGLTLVASRVFEKSTQNTYLDTALTLSHNRADQVNSEISKVLQTTQNIVLGYKPDERTLNDQALALLKGDEKIQALQIYNLESAAGAFSKAVDIQKNDSIAKPALEHLFVSQLIAQAQANGLSLQSGSSGGSWVWLAARFGDANDPKQVIGVVLFAASDLAQVFSSTGNLNGFLVKRGTGEEIVSPQASAFPGLKTADAWRVVGKSKAPGGVLLFSLANGKDYLATYVDTGVADLAVVTMSDRHTVLEAVDQLTHRTLFLTLALICLAAFFAFLRSDKRRELPVA